MRIIFFLSPDITFYSCIQEHIGPWCDFKKVWLSEIEAKAEAQGAGIAVQYENTI
jgi:hypothetical protein